MSRGFGSTHAAKMLAFLAALTAERRSTGGWVTVARLALEANISRATAYRWIQKLRDHGVKIESDRPDRTGMPHRGVRCELVLQRRDHTHHRTPIRPAAAPGAGDPHVQH